MYHPQSQGMVERAKGVLKGKFCSGEKINLVNALPLALMEMRMQTNCRTHLTPHEMLMGRPMPCTYLRALLRDPYWNSLKKNYMSM